MDKQTVKKIASLSRLEMDDAMLDRMGQEITGILKWIEQLGEVNTDNVEPLSNVVGINLESRADVVNDGACADKVLANAPETTQGYFVVPKIIEQEE